MTTFRVIALSALFSLSLYFSSGVYAQQETWVETPFWSEAAADARITARNAQYFELAFESIYSSLVSGELMEIDLPINGEGTVYFEVIPNTLLHPDLASRYPEMAAFNIVSKASRNVWGKLEISPKGLRAMVFIPGESPAFIDPIFADNNERYISYRKADFTTDKQMTCYVGQGKIDQLDLAKAGTPYNDCSLKTYRLALAASAEYTAFHGGTVADAVDAQITSMNRVNGIYERDFGVTLTIIANNDILIYTNAATDPYTNGDAGAMLQENQANVNSAIGAANYDLGHVFGTNSGGVAGLGVTCTNNSKARGVTGSPSPINDPFDIDYVAHEMGHQFGGNHSFNNSCGGNRNGGTAVEPGSGSTIMAYAGICPSNVQNNSDDHFHGVNMREIGIEITEDNCAVITAVDNISPEIGALQTAIFIPISTPFVLTGIASDADGDELTYCWEQMDIEISTQPPLASNTGGPNFRSNLPSTNPQRYFPALSALADNGPFTWERLPSVGRTMNFRLSVRDNAPVAGCTQYEDVDVNVVATAGPFELTYPSATGIVWQGFSYQTVTWDVASTDAAPINAETVDIFLSTDGGLTYPTQIADNVPNVGSYPMQSPNIATTTARIMVINSQGTFFDVSNSNFIITVIENGFALETSTLGSTVCQGEMAVTAIDIIEIGTFDEPLGVMVTNLPPNAEVVITPPFVSVGDSFTVQISTSAETVPGFYAVTIAVSGFGFGFENELTYNLTVLDAELDAPVLLAPLDLESGLSTTVQLSWDGANSPMVNYDVEVSSTADFSAIVFLSSDLTATSISVAALLSSTTYYWRVRSSNACGDSPVSQVFSFTTFQCISEDGSALPIEIPATGIATVTAPVLIMTEGVVADLNVTGITGIHPNISELTFSLVSPQGTIVQLTSGNCGLNITLNPNTVVVNSPGVIAGNYTSSATANFGAALPFGGLSGAVALASDGTGNPNELCNPAVNGTEIFGKIALVYRGTCPFVQKVLNAQNAGAIAVIVINNQPGTIDMGGNSNEINIPSVMVSSGNGAILISGLGGDASNFNFSFDDEALTGPIPCPATSGGVFIPNQQLAAFNGEMAQGLWTLQIDDLISGNGGQLTDWNLEICLDNVTSDGLRSATAQSFRVFPNPGRDNFTVETSAVSFDKAEVFDFSGRLIFVHIINETPRFEIDLSRHSDGIYFIRLSGKGQSAVQRIVKAE